MGNAGITSSPVAIELGSDGLRNQTPGERPSFAARVQPATRRLEVCGLGFRERLLIVLAYLDGGSLL